MLLFEAPMYVDPEVMEQETVVFASRLAGSVSDVTTIGSSRNRSSRRTQSIRIRTDDLFQDVPIVVTSLAEPAAVTRELVVDVTRSVTHDVPERT